MKKIKAIEVFICLIFTIISILGINYSIDNRVVKNSGTITMENYSKYLKFSSSTNGGRGSSVEMFYDVNVAAKSISYYEISNLSITYKLTADHATFPTYSKTNLFISSKDITLIDNFNASFIYSGGDQTEWMRDDKKITFELISINGNYAYSLQGVTYD